MGDPIDRKQQIKNALSAVLGFDDDNDEIIDEEEEMIYNAEEILSKSPISPISPIAGINGEHDRAKSDMNVLVNMLNDLDHDSPSNHSNDTDDILERMKKR